jgi:hypothetical protein
MKAVILRVHVVNYDSGYIGKGSTLRAAVKAAAEKGTRSLAMMKEGDTATITRLKDTIL